MKIATFLFTLLILQTHLHAQCAPTFFTQYGQPNQAEKGESLLETASGELFLGGSSGDPARPFLMKLDEKGDILWSRSYETPMSCLFGQLLELSDGNLLASTFPNSTPNISFLFKLTQNGDIIWVKNFQTASLVKGSLAKTADGGFVAATNEQPNSIFFSINKYSVNGDLIWQKGFKSVGNTNLVAQIIETANENLLLAGYTNANAAGIYDQMVVRLDKNGVILWQKNYASDEPDVFYSCDELPDGNLVFSGSTHALSGNSDGIILKTDAVGNIIWQRIFSATDIDFMYCFDQKITPDGIVLLVMDRSPNNPKKRLFSIKFDENGQFLASNQYSDAARSAYFRHIWALKNGQFLFSGTTEEADNSTQTDAFLMRTDSLGFVENCQNTTHQNTILGGNLTAKTGFLTAQNALGSIETAGFSETILMEKIEICPLICDTICNFSAVNIQFPNAFTPDGDGLNEFFTFIDSSKCIKTIKDFSIYNHWGNLIFSKQNLEILAFGNGWNGQIEGQNAPTDVYIFKCVFELLDGSIFQKSGDFTLIR
jgi:gliding motility-associated-like protein